jgi:hypothetical protein
MYYINTIHVDKISLRFVIHYSISKKKKKKEEIICELIFFM